MAQRSIAIAFVASVVGACGLVGPAPTPTSPPLSACDSTYHVGTVSGLSDGVGDTRGWDHVYCLQLTLARSAGWEQTVQAVILADQSADPLRDRQLVAYHPGGPGISAVDRTVAEPPTIDPSRYAVLAWDGTTSGETPGACGPTSVSFLMDRNADTLADLATRTASECSIGFGGAADVGAWAAAEELEEIRRALGIEQLSMLTLSYGTAIAEAYIRIHPDRVERAVLDAPIGLDIAWSDRVAAVNDVIRAGANELARQCTSERCRAVLGGIPASESYGALRRAILAAHPSVGSGSVVLTPVMLDEATLLTLHTDELWNGWADAADAALGGDATALWRIGERLYLDIDRSAFYRSICADIDRPSTAAGYTIGTDPLLFAFTSELAPCIGFPHGEVRARQGTADARPQVFLVASLRDPVSPAAMVEAAPSLTGLGLVCITDLTGHTNYHNELVRDLVHEFLAGADITEPVASACRAS
jgi:pimeloyl-ACP methyl ester carboxylesterase